MSNCIRVLQVGMSEYYGGTESFIMNQYRSIDKAKVQFDFLNVYKGKIACQDEIEMLGGKIYNLDMSRRNGLKAYYSRLDEFFKNNSKCFDVVHCNYQSLINIDILKFAKKYGVKVRIAHAHNSGYGKEPNILQKLIITKNKLTLGSYATNYFACSQLASNWMFNREAIVVKNAIDSNAFRFSEQVRNKVRAANGVENEFIILFVGRLDPQKNPLFLLDVFSRIVANEPNAKLWVVGDGILKDQMIQKINELDIEESVEFLGSRKDVNELVQAADAFVLPSIFEGLGIVLVEAQAASLPTFTSDRVPNDAKLCDLLEFIPLEKTADEWAKIIINNSHRERVDMKQVVCDAGYDNCENAKKLEALYQRFLGRA